MLSEWLVEVPVDIAEKWLLILCPEVCFLCLMFICYKLKSFCRAEGTS